MKAGEIAIVVCMVLGGVLVAGVIGTHMHDCIIINRIKKQKAVHDAERIGQSKTSGAVLSGLAIQKPPTIRQNARGFGTPKMRNGLAHSSNSQSSGTLPSTASSFQKSNSLIVSPTSALSFDAPTTPSSPFSPNDHLPLLIHAMNVSFDEKPFSLPAVPPRISRERLAKFASPPRKAPLPRLSIMRPRVIYARSVSELLGSAAAPSSTETQGTAMSRIEAVQEVSKFGW
ncbi:MAG: hypothetical protein CYPHOPRED_001478 [Cyphobasidiales sp. Tagirdzhanova-0007]|nr:MAG: hypothetical protein CYPHOPRED_001478 [Cyphobasidiales sp. Tagirdzhanova-0007]